MTSKVCVVGSLVYDLSVTVPTLPRRGESVVGSDLRAQPGGKGFNQATAAARAGAATTMVGRLGADGYAEAFLRALAADGIDAAHVSQEEGAPTGLAFPFVESATGDNAIVVVLGANEALTDAVVDEAAADLGAADVVLLQFEVPMSANVRAAALAHAGGARVIVNPAPAAPLPAELACHVGILVANLVEAQTLLDTGLAAPEELAVGLRELHGVSVAIVTLGADGAVLADAAGVRRHAAPLVDCVDSVGAGDAFCGYLAARLARGDDIDTALRWACAAGAVAVTRRGAAVAVPHTAEVHALLAAVAPA